MAICVKMSKESIILKKKKKRTAYTKDKLL